MCDNHRAQQLPLCYRSVMTKLASPFRVKPMRDPGDTLLGTSSIEAATRRNDGDSRVCAFGSLFRQRFYCPLSSTHTRGAAHWVRMQAEGSDASTPRSFNSASATGHSRAGIARPVPRRRPPPRTPEPLWSLLLFHIRSRLWRALSWLFEVRSVILCRVQCERPLDCTASSSSGRSDVGNCFDCRKAAQQIKCLNCSVLIVQCASLIQTEMRHANDLPALIPVHPGKPALLTRSQEFQPWLKWIIFDAFLTLALAVLLRRYKRLRPVLEALGRG